MPVRPSPQIVIALPARDEEQGIVRTLRALAAQRGALPPFAVLLLANNCRDGTAEVARRCQPAGLDLRIHEVTLPPGQANVVGARRRALDLAADLAGPRGVIVSTDADTSPQPGWLAALLAPLQPTPRPGVPARGVAASAGRLLLDPAERARLSPEVRRTHLLDCAYRAAASQLSARLDPDPADPWPRHWQHFGASLALHVWAYRAVGGLPDVDCLEDLALVHALRGADLAVRHTPAARAYTSARLSGRVPVGLSTQLREWQAGPQGWTVPGAAEVTALACAEAALKGAYQRPEAARHLLSGLWLLPQETVEAALGAPTCGLALSRAHRAREQAGLWASRHPAQPVAQALADLRLILAGNTGTLPSRLERAWSRDQVEPVPSTVPCSASSCAPSPGPLAGRISTSSR